MRVSRPTSFRILLVALLSVEVLILFGRVIMVESWLITSLFGGSMALAAIMLKLAENARPVPVLVLTLGGICCLPLYSIFIRSACTFDELAFLTVSARQEAFVGYCYAGGLKREASKPGMHWLILPRPDFSSDLLLVTVWPQDEQNERLRAEQALAQPLKTFLRRMSGLSAVKREPYTLTEEFSCD
jgi:uncharacterized membrane protein (UPF0136 family)